MLKKLVSVLLVAIMALSMVSVAFAEDDVITMWVEAGQEVWMENALALFHETYPDVEVEMTIYNTDDMKNQPKIAAASNTLPDMWQSWGGNLGGYFIDNGLTYDLTEVAKELNFSEVFTEAAMSASSRGDKVVSIPRNMSTYGIIYHKPTFEAAGWTELPKTAEELDQLLADIKEKTGKAPLAFASGNGWQMMRLMMYLLDANCGSETLDKMLNMETDWNNPGTVAALTKLKEWADKGYFPEGYITLQPNDTRMLLYAGLAAITSGSISELSSIIGEGYDVNEFGIMPFPDSSEDGYTRQNVGTNVLLLSPELTPEKAKIVAFLGMCISDPTVAKATIEAGGSQGTTIGYGSRKDYVATIEQAQTLTDFTNIYGPMVLIDQALTAENADLWFYVQDVVCEGTMTPEEALAYFDANRK